MFLAFVVLHILSSCQNSIVNDAKTTNPIYQDNFPNILNLKGTPDSTTDRSIFIFSDKGAWFGYGLPSNKRPGFYGSFTGPYLLTQDNGVWMCPVLSQLEIIDAKTNRIISLADAENKEINSYPGKLSQVFWTKNPELLVASELIFVTDRTALTKVSIENPAKNADVQVRVRWKGDGLLDGVSFSEHENGLQIEFAKNENIGMVSTDAEKEFFLHDNSYEILTSPQLIKAKDFTEFQLTHSFCFSKKEWEIEQSKLGRIFQNPELIFSENKERWDFYLKNILNNLDEEFDDKSHQKIAVKCLQTLTTNWRSPAGFLKHDGLFPSYNYEWFHGFWAWDSWKHAVALANFNTSLAQNQIRAMYDFQDNMGMIADCVYRDTIIENHNWRDTKPPLSAWAIWEVYEKSKDENFLKEIFPKAEKYHQWWYQYRDHDQNGLCEYGSTDGTLIAAKWESGMDNAVRFDETKIVQNNEHGWSMNRESVDLNAYLFAEKKYLSKIANAIGETTKSENFEKESKALKLKIQTEFYDEETGWFYDIDLESKKHLKAYGAEGWIPLWAGAATSEQAAKLRNIMVDTTKFATYIPFPTLAADHPRFKPNRGYWRGPIWIDQAYFAIKGLKNYGYEEDALRFSHQLFDRLEGLKNADGPIWENYHPHTGEGMESKHFSWSAALLLMLMMEE